MGGWRCRGRVVEVVMGWEWWFGGEVGVVGV